MDGEGDLQVGKRRMRGGGGGEDEERERERVMAICGEVTMFFERRFSELMVRERRQLSQMPQRHWPTRNVILSMGN